MDNLDEFNIAAGTIFAELLESFPVPTRLCYTLAVERPAGVDRDMMNATLEWLADENLVRIGSRQRAGNNGLHRTYHQVVLTNEALQVLGKTPRSLRRPVGTAIRDAVKDGEPWMG